MNGEGTYHYYGTSVRMLFLLAGLIMIISYPFFNSFIKAPMAVSIIGVVALSVFAGFMNPKQKWIIIVNTIISIGAFVIFEYAAVYTYLHLPPTEAAHVAFFWVNQILSLIFFFASYLSTKTFRGALLTN